MNISEITNFLKMTHSSRALTQPLLSSHKVILSHIQLLYFKSNIQSKDGGLKFIRSEILMPKVFSGIEKQ